MVRTEQSAPWDRAVRTGDRAIRTMGPDGPHHATGQSVAWDRTVCSMGPDGRHWGPGDPHHGTGRSASGTGRSAPWDRTVRTMGPNGSHRGIGRSTSWTKRSVPFVPRTDKSVCATSTALPTAVPGKRQNQCGTQKPHLSPRMRGRSRSSLRARQIGNGFGESSSG